MSLRLHPPFARLRDFARGDLDEPRRRRVAAHLARCTRCRSEITHIRSILDSLSSDGAPPSEALAAILERRAAGSRIILPTMDPAVRRLPPRALPRAAALALLVAGAVAAALVYTPELDAEQSELHVSPERPTRGATLTVTYRATSRLDDEDRLVLRARYRKANHGRDIAHAVLGTLERTGPSTYVANVRLPDSAVYAVLAIEDEEASFVDHNGERWEVLVHDEARRPLFDALWQRYADVQLRDSRTAADVVAEMLRLYPERPEGLRAALFDETSTAPDAARDSIRRRHRERYFAGAVQGVDGEPEPDVFYLASMVFYADAVGDTAGFERYKALLYERYPRHQATLQRRSFDLSTVHRGEPEALLDAYEALFREAGTGVQVAFSAFNLAVRRQEPDQIERWGKRFTAEDSTFIWFVATHFAEVPALRAHAARLMRTALARHAALGDDRRAITQTRDEFAAGRRVREGTMLTSFGQTLLALGDTAAALDALERAFDSGWDPQRFRTLAGLRLALGDTIAARNAIARVAVDPTTRAAGDSLREQLANAGRGEEWTNAVAAARNDMMASVWQRAVNRAPLLPRLRLDRLGGGKETIELATGTPVVIAFWSRYCPPSFAQLGEMDRTLQRLADEGVPVFPITDEDLSSVRAFLEEKGYVFPVYVDPENDASRAFDRPGTPTYFVLDDEGRIRFETHVIGDVVRFAHALRPVTS